MKYSFALYCPQCQKYGVTVTLHVDLSKRTLFHCPCCGSKFTLDDLRHLFKHAKHNNNKKDS